MQTDLSNRLEMQSANQAPFTFNLSNNNSNNMPGREIIEEEEEDDDDDENTGRQINRDILDDNDEDDEKEEDDDNDNEPKGGSKLNISPIQLAFLEQCKKVVNSNLVNSKSASQQDLSNHINLDAIASKHVHYFIFDNELPPNSTKIDLYFRKKIILYFPSYIICPHCHCSDKSSNGWGKPRLVHGMIYIRTF